MKVQLNWVNRNRNPALVDIYRTTIYTTTPDESDKIATGIDATTLKYIDETALYGVTYYYVFKTYDTSDNVIWSSPKTVKVHIDTGPGPQELILGNYELGYFGAVAWNDIGSNTEICTQIGITAATINTAGQSYYDKFIRKGKIIFVPRQHITSVTSWDKAYLCGGIYGTDDTGPANLTYATKVVQSARFTKNGYTYKVRLPRGIEDSYMEVLPIDYVNNQTVLPYRYDSEVAQLIYPRFRYAPIEQGFPQLPNVQLTYSTAGFSNPYISSTLSNGGNNWINSMDTFSNGATAAQQRSLSNGTGGKSLTASSVFWYLPVLELDSTLLSVGV